MKHVQNREKLWMNSADRRRPAFVHRLRLESRLFRPHLEPM